MTFDTNILIAYLDNEEAVFAAVKRLKEAGRLFFLPAMAEAELLAYPEWDAAQRTVVEKFWRKTSFSCRWIELWRDSLESYAESFN